MPKFETLSEVKSDNRKSAEVFALFLDLLESVSQCSNFDELKKQAGEASQKLMRVNASSLMLLDEKGEYLHVIMPTGPVRSEIKDKKIPADKGYAGWVAANQKPIIANNVQDDEIFYGEISKDFTTKRLICVPLLDDNGNTQGVLQVINRADDEPFNETDIPVLESFANHTARTINRLRAKRKVEKLLKEKELFFQEIHHRVKNDFAMISGIVEMGSLKAESKSARKVLDSVRSRIQTVAAVYDLLAYIDSDTHVETSVFFDQLIDRISTARTAKDADINIKVESDDFQINSQMALSLGLILNELLMNSYKHAFDSEKGTINIRFTKAEHRVKLSYHDNGKGLPDDFDLDSLDSLGIKIIQALVKQLNGSIKKTDKNGAGFKISFQH
jgi:two-component sensor histidine kinase